MKREYSKPTIHVEVMSLDMPVAAACDTYSESPELKIQGWFASDGCIFRFDGENGDLGYIDSVGDTVCYHSHVRTTLQS
jgi:hypothetical protein